MTSTAHAAPISTSPKIVLARLDAFHAATPHPDDVPGLSFNERRAGHERLAHRERILNQMRASVAEAADFDRRLFALQAERAPLQAAVTALDAQIADAPRWSDMTDREVRLDAQIADAPRWSDMTDREVRDREQRRHDVLTTAREAAITGVGVFTALGQTMMPAPLRAFLASTCPTCHHETLKWPGSLDELDADIEKLTRRRDDAHQAVLTCVAAALRLLNDAAE